MDVLKPLGHKQIIEHELEGFGIRLNKKPPNIYFKQKEKGGLALSVQCPQSELDKELVAVRFEPYLGCLRGSFLAIISGQLSVF